MSISEPSIRIRTESPLSFSNFPLRGTLISPETTCKTTGNPIQLAYAISMFQAPSGLLYCSLLRSVLTQTESLTAQKPKMVHRGYERGTNVLLSLLTAAFYEDFLKVQTYWFFGTPGLS